MRSLISLCLLTLSATPALANPGVYMGQASTGEQVYYQGARFQCGDLPRHDECWWRTPMISYVIGTDSVSAIGDCQNRVFREVWLDGEIVATNMVPQSEAIQLVLDTACNTAQ